MPLVLPVLRRWWTTMGPCGPPVVVSLNLALSNSLPLIHHVVDNNAISEPRFSCPPHPPWSLPARTGGGRQLSQHIPPFSSRCTLPACPFLLSPRWWTTMPSTVPLSHPSPPPCTPMHAQVVDDNLINRRVAASTLARYGAEVALAESGEAALRLLQVRHSFRLVLMDLHMPALDGFQTTARLRAFEGQAHTAHLEMHGGQGAQGEQGGQAVPGGQGTQDVQPMPAVRESGAEGREGGWQQWQRVHVVAMSADVDSTVVACATEAGMDGAVQKPLNERLLLQVLSTLNGW
ncbi:unnamed protein product [Closterium sp. Yama58-4]|nr:unnamed protein product [Closterium sp. Yama58-4]